jgi:hypothetical protein
MGMRRWALPGALMVAMVCCFVSGQPVSRDVRAQVAEDKAARKGSSAEKDLALLKNVFGASKIAVLSRDQGSLEGQLTDIVELFGKRYLQLRNDLGRNQLVNTEFIISIRQK